jgi:LysM repeat protein
VDAAEGRVVVVHGEGVAVPVVFESVSTTRLINYVVRRGDNLWKIARSFGTSAQTLAKLNRIPLSKPLRRGQRIKIQVDVTQQSGRS